MLLLCFPSLGNAERSLNPSNQHTFTYSLKTSDIGAQQDRAHQWLANTFISNSYYNCLFIYLFCINIFRNWPQLTSLPPLSLIKSSTQWCCPGSSAGLSSMAPRRAVNALTPPPQLKSWLIVNLKRCAQFMRQGACVSRWASRTASWSECTDLPSCGGEPSVSWQKFPSNVPI